jgi:actin related protein 2/3 complex subunit 5
MRVLQAFKASEIEAGIKLLDKTEVDILMKYIYRGFAESTDNASAILLSWHDKVRSEISQKKICLHKHNGSSYI